MKPVFWLGSSKADLSAFPDEVKSEIGNQLFQVQLGLEPMDWKPMSTIGAGVKEIRVQAEGQWRLLYVAKFVDGIYVLHAFGKKTQRTAKMDLDLAVARYRSLVNQQRVK